MLRAAASAAAAAASRTHHQALSIKSTTHVAYLRGSDFSRSIHFPARRGRASAPTRAFHFPGRDGSRGTPPPPPPPRPYTWLFRAKRAPTTAPKPVPKVAAAQPPPPPPLPPLPPLPQPIPFSWARDLALPLAFCGASSAACLIVAGALSAEDAAGARGRTVRRVVDAILPDGEKKGAADTLPAWVSYLPPFFRDAIAAATGWWEHRSPFDRTFGAILAANLAVTAAWKVGGGPAGPGGWRAGLPGLWRSAMRRSFAQALPPSRPRLRSLFLSNWSHGSLLHLLANMLALHALGEGVAAAQGERQFAGFYAAAGPASAAAAHAGLWLRARAMGGVASSGGMSLGASGAVYAVLVAAACLTPDRPVPLLFQPEGTRTPTLKEVTGALVVFDALGALAGWRWLDHWGHLGGAAFGFAWAATGAGPAAWEAAKVRGASARLEWKEWQKRRAAAAAAAEREARRADMKASLPGFLGGGKK